MAEEHPKFILTADVIAVVDDVDIVTIVRNKDPFCGKYALSGGHRELSDPTLAHTAQRELWEETGIWVSLDELMLFHILDKLGRDPRGEYVSIVYTVRLTRVDYERMKHAGSDAKCVELVPLAEVEARKNDFAFDHFDAIQEYIGVFGAEARTFDV